METTTGYKKLYYVSVQPAIRYYAWQVEVMLNNFLKNGVQPEQIHILAVVKNGEMALDWDNLRRKYSDVGFFFYEDTRESKEYISSIRPNILKKHFAAFPELEQAAIFYHDCDMIFTKPVNWDSLLADDVWYCSDTIWYINADYIKSKKYGIYEKMCEIIGIPLSVPETNNKDSGGAQYILKNINAKYWEKVEKDSENLYKFFKQHLIAFPQSDTYHPIQMWTADMWAVLWNGWYYNHTVKVTPKMNFTWPMHTLDDWEKCDIYHNAGVVLGQENGMFNKTRFVHKLPYTNINLEEFDQKKCSYLYVQEILESANTSCLLDGN